MPEFRLEQREAKLGLAWEEQFFAVDYLSKEFQYRLRTSLRPGDLLIRAVGATRDKPSICDLTMGLGYDMVQLAAWGCRVEAWERNPQVFALVHDALERASGEEWRARITIHQGDGKKGPFAAQVFYLDPMYPSEGRSRPKKELVALKSLVGADEDAFELYEVAKRSGAQRIVVKRPDRADTLAPNPHHIIKGKTIRFDIYQ